MCYQRPLLALPPPVLADVPLLPPVAETVPLPPPPPPPPPPPLILVGRFFDGFLMGGSLLPESDTYTARFANRSWRLGPRSKMKCLAWSNIRSSCQYI